MFLYDVFALSNRIWFCVSQRYCLSYSVHAAARYICIILSYNLSELTSTDPAIGGYISCLPYHINKYNACKVIDPSL